MGQLLGGTYRRKMAVFWISNYVEEVQPSISNFQALFSLSLRNGVHLRSWDPLLGHIYTEFFLDSSSNQGVLMCNSKSDVLSVILSDKYLELPSRSRSFSRDITFPLDTKKFSTLLTSSEFSAVLSDPENPFSMAHVDFLHPAKVTALEFTVPAGVSVKSCELFGKTLACVGEMSDKPVIVSTVITNQNSWNFTPLTSKSEEIIRLCNDRFGLLQRGSIAAFYAVDENSGHLNFAYNLSNVTKVFASSEDTFFGLFRDHLKHHKNVNLAAFNPKSGVNVPLSFVDSFTVNLHHGDISKLSILPDQGGLLLFTEDHATQVIDKEGNQLWLREEALAHITAVKMVDLPVSSQQATMQEEFGQQDARIAELFVNRIRSQAIQLSRAFRDFFHLDDRQEGRLRAENGENGVAGANGEYKPLTRDAYNLNKMIVVVTACGKIFGLESLTGRIVWEYFIPGISLLFDVYSEPSGPVHLFQQRTTGHFPLPPIACVLLMSKATGLPVVFYFDPIIGVALNGHTLKAVTAEEEQTGEHLLHLTKRLKQVVLVPGPISAEKTNHIRPLCLIMEDLTVLMLPEAVATRSGLLPAPSLLVYVMSRDPASVSGFRVVERAASGNASGAVYVAEPVWHMHLSSEDAPQKIILAATRPSIEHVYSVGRVLGDRNVLYKYINPNLLAVLTTGVSRSPEKVDVTTLHLIDVVLGQIIHSAVHRRACEPASLVVSENWVLYSIYNQRSLRAEFTIIELFEPRRADASLMPVSPWQIFSQSILPTSAALATPQQQEGTQRASSTGGAGGSHFSSFERAANSAFGASGGDSASTSSLVPEILQRSYIMASPVRPGAVAVSLTERGITAKSLLFALETGNLLELPKSLVDPRRTMQHTPELQEEGLEPYAPELPLSTFAVISYNKTLERVRRIHTAPSGLESTSLVFAHGLDIFFTRIAPSKTFDLLRDDFDNLFIAMIVIGMCVGSVVAHRLAVRREVSKAWQ